MVLITLIAILVKFSADNILKYFSYFSQKTGSDLHEIPDPVFLKYKKNVIMLSICHLLNLPREW